MSDIFFTFVYLSIIYLFILPGGYRGKNRAIDFHFSVEKK